MAQNGRLDGHPRWVAVQTAILCHTFLCVAQGNQSMRNSSIQSDVFLLACSAFFSVASTHAPTNSQISAPSKLPIVTSNRLDLSFFTQFFPPLNRRDFLAWRMVSISWSEISVNMRAKARDLRRRSSDMDG